MIIKNNREYGVCVVFASVTPPDYFYVQDVSGQANNIYIKKSDAAAPSVTVEYSTDGATWSTLGITDTTAISTSIAANGKLYLKATANAWGNSSKGNVMSFDGDVNVGGNIMSLLNGDNFENTNLTNNYAFPRLFEYTSNLHTGKVIDASNLELPDNCTSLCYYAMFNNQNKLTAAPVMRASVLAWTSCYHMYADCSQLDTIVSYMTDISATNCLQGWLTNTKATGSFYNLGNPAPTFPSGSDGIPTGWTEYFSL